MITTTHKRHVRTLPTSTAFKVAERLARGNIPFVFETLSTTRSQTAMISCHFEETLDYTIGLVEGSPEARLRVALDPEEPKS